MKNLNSLLESIATPFLPITSWLLRLGLGTSFILHGIGKFPLPSEKMVTWFESMGYMYPELVTSMVAIDSKRLFKFFISNKYLFIAFDSKIQAKS
jgi:hypothetical protein